MVARVPVVLLNKADLSDDPERTAAAVRARLPLVDVVAASALHDLGLDALAPYLRAAQTIALVGSSGVGKSTLVNRLLGRDALRVAAISESDGRGRHTTTARQLVELVGGALLIDTPGMRELQPWADDAAVTGVRRSRAGRPRAGSAIAHAGEPGCAVAEAVDAGRIEADRGETIRPARNRRSRNGNATRRRRRTRRSVGNRARRR